MRNIINNKMLFLTGSAAALLIALQAISPLWAQGNTNVPAEADKLHVVLLVAGNDGHIGNADMKDIAAMRKAIDFAFSREMARVVYHDLTGKNPQTGTYYSGTEIVAYLRAMKTGANDNILVYHSGHGCITDKARPEDSQILVVDGGQLARKALRDALAPHKPRALIILTDCCSSYAAGAAGLAAGRSIAPAASVNTATVSNLLLKSVGVISITAAEDGTMAIASFQGDNPGQAGSAFTVALMRLWYNHDRTFTSWEQLFPSLRTETRLASGGVHQARAFQISEVVATVGDDLQRPWRR